VGVVLAHGLHASRIDGSALVYNAAHPYLPDLLICQSGVALTLLDALASSLGDTLATDRGSDDR
jgi:3'(2'), 5'-bisphosphate nucleotidase